MAYRIAKALDVLRSQVNARWPTRSKASDGWIGDTSHSARKSDHNPNSAGVVQALDITHDPKSGCDAYKLAETLRIARDPRIKYVISNGRIFSSLVQPWTWRPYSGANKHDKHTHISVNDSAVLYDDTKPWTIDSVPETDWRIAALKNIVNWEAARDSAGHLQVHTPGDGSFEVAGISSNSHPELAAKLRSLIQGSQYEEAERLVIDFIRSYTQEAQNWTVDRGVEFFLRDCIYNRGPKGAANILQRAVGVKVDEVVGPLTLAAVNRIPPSNLLTLLRAAREAYEIAKYGRREQYWKGLTNRWNNALAVAKALDAAPPAPKPLQDTKWVQNALNALGAKPPLEVDGRLGPRTREMLSLFQKENGLPVTGAPRPETIAALEKHLAQPITLGQKIEAPKEGFWKKFWKLFGD